jgi:hypothetical protein
MGIATSCDVNQKALDAAVTAAYGDDPNTVCGLVKTGSKCPNYGGDGSSSLQSTGSQDMGNGYTACTYSTTDPDTRFHVFDAGAYIKKDNHLPPALGADRVKWWADTFVTPLPCVVGEFKSKVVQPFLSSYVPAEHCPALVKTAFEAHDPTGEYTKKCLPAASSDQLTRQVVDALGGTTVDPKGTICLADPSRPRCQVAQYFDVVHDAYCAANTHDPRCSCYNRYDPYGLEQVLAAVSPGARPECWWGPCQDPQFYRNSLARRHPVGGACGDPPPKCQNLAVIVNNKNLVVGDLDQYISGCGGTDPSASAGILKYWPYALVGVGAAAAIALIVFYYQKK